MHSLSVSANGWYIGHKISETTNQDKDHLVKIWREGVWKRKECPTRSTWRLRRLCFKKDLVILLRRTWLSQLAFSFYSFSVNSDLSDYLLTDYQNRGEGVIISPIHFPFPPFSQCSLHLKRLLIFLPVNEGVIFFSLYPHYLLKLEYWTIKQQKSAF